MAFRFGERIEYFVEYLVEQLSSGNNCVWCGIDESLFILTVPH